MTRAVSLGYLTLPAEVFGEPRWSVTPAGQEPLSNPVAVAAWQYTTDLLVERLITCDSRVLREQAGLASSDELRAVVTWTSTSTGLQGSSGVVSLKNGVNEVSVTIPGVETGGSLKLRTVIAAGVKADAQRQDLAASRSGAVLYTDDWIVHLEGDASRFPTEALSFSATGLGDPGTAWRLIVDTSDLDASALAAIRLIVNTDTEAHHRLTNLADTEQAEITRRFMSYDVARQLVLAGLAQEELTSIEYEPGSVGSVLRSRLKGYFGAEGDAVEPLRARWLLAPADIDAELQRHFNL